MPDQGTPTTNPSPPSLADEAVLGLHSASGTTSPSVATFATFDKFLAGLPPSEKVSVHKLYSLAKQGKLPIYRLPGVKPVCVKVDEARAVLATLTAQGRIRRSYGSFGENANLKDLSNVVGQTFEVDQ